MSKDTIYREDAIKAVDAFLGTDPIVERIKRLPSADIFEITKEALIEAIDNAETVGDVVENFIDRPTVRPQGEWIDIEPRLNRRRVNKYKQCSRCGFSWARPLDDNFCPNCGAHMKGAGE